MMRYGMTGVFGIFSLIFALVPIIILVWAMVKLSDIASYLKIIVHKMDQIERDLKEIKDK